MSEAVWRVLDGDGNEQGPYSTQDLQGYYTTGNITHETMVWAEGYPEWLPAGQVEGLLPIIPQVIDIAGAKSASAAAANAVSPAPLDPLGTDLPAQIPTSNGAPTWISILTLLSGIAALVLFFFPWISLWSDATLFKGDKEQNVMTQSGIQSITQSETMSPEFIKVMAKAMGATDEDIEENWDEMLENAEKEISDSNDKPEYEKSIFVLIALISVGLGILLSLIGLIKNGRALIISAQFLFVIAALLIGIQMATQFPLPATLMEQKEAEIAKRVEAAEAIEKGSGKNIAITGASSSGSNFEISPHHDSTAGNRSTPAGRRP